MTATKDEQRPRLAGAVQRFITRLRDWWRGAPRLILYEFDRLDELIAGWQTHVAKQLAIHEESARRAQSRHYRIGVIAAVFASLAGSSAVVAWQTQTSNERLAFASALIAGAASVLTGIVTFLDLGGRAERHRKAAADYKAALRELEATWFPPTRLDSLQESQSAFIAHLRSALEQIDASAPIPPRRLAKRIASMDVDSRPSVVASRQDQPSALAEGTEAEGIGGLSHIGQPEFPGIGQISGPSASDQPDMNP